MGQDGILDLGGRDVLASSDDRVVGSSFDEQVAGTVEACSVVGGEPAVVVEDRSMLQILPRDLGAADPEQTGRSGRGGCAVLVAEQDLDAGNGTSDGGEPAPDGRIVGGQRCAVIVGAEERDRRTGLRQTVCIDESGIGKCDQGAFEDR